MVMILVNARVVTPDRLLNPGWIALDGHRISAVGAGEPPRSADAEIHDLGLDYVLPGFVDLHMHGGDGAQVTTENPQEILRAIAFHRRHGTTRTLASLVTSPVEEMAAAARTVAALMRSPDPLHRSIAGIHLEGPFLNPNHRGAHHNDYVLAPDVKALRHLLASGDGAVRTVTLAPELDGGMDLVREVVASGAVVAVGHTDASYDEAHQAFEAGASMATHLFNAMRPFHHREPGPAGAALTHDNVTCELINDGVHLHSATTRLAFAAAGAERIALVTDATPAAGVNDGRFNLGPLPVLARDGKVTLLDGITNAGSTLTMDRAVRHAVQCVGIPITQAAIAAATTPARLLGLGEQTGSISPGKDADLVVLTDDLRVRTVIAHGTVVHGTLATGGVSPLRRDLDVRI
ncbi:N-acetylglucosamine-6-phosphate deacetylase [Nonomuraea sp. NPDC059023]|uniref:N-acetylglucosamine-6-phosphate deacetylase n=1 Tax=unclassified Nonomuraea TaxID=2593643 RepID=UPI0036BBE92A